MELWIRNQDKLALSKIEQVAIEYDKKIIGYNRYCVKLGVYETKERALEVLDEIQHRLITLCDSMNRHLYVYEMPLD